MKILSRPFLDCGEQIKQDIYSFDFIEYRLDYSPDWYKAEKLLSFDMKTIITIRDTAEGGVHSVPLADKISYYERVIQDYNVMIDLELRNFEVIMPNIPDEHLIVSCHILDEEIDVIKEIEDTIEKCNRIRAKFLKVVAPISSYSQLLQIKQLANKSINPFLFVGTGKLGKLTRILWRELDSIGTYLGLEGQKTSSAQLTPDEYSIYDADSITENTLLGGLIGGEQVYSSLGLNHYNQIFRRKELNAVYLPLPVDELSDFLGLVKELQKRYRFFGFSLTMPFKSRLPEKITGRKTPPCNLVIPIFDSEAEREAISGKARCYNTDEDAFLKSFVKLDINKVDSIMILGTGGVAETLLKMVVEYPNVIIVGRNRERLAELGTLYRREARELSELNSINYEMLINCSPLGMNGEDLFEVTGLNYPQKLIDLPYIKEGVTVAINRCIERNIPYVDGKTFWKYQAERQEELFLESIRYLNTKNSLTQTFDEIDFTEEG
jgi:3-dehydroquinate dehydratase type I